MIDDVDMGYICCSLIEYLHFVLWTDEFAWTKPGVLLLIELYRASQEKFKHNTFTKAKLWMKIAGDLSSKWKAVTPKQANNKFRSLKMR